jgi:hypothetical protein
MTSKKNLKAREFASSLRTNSMGSSLLLCRTDHELGTLFEQVQTKGKFKTQIEVQSFVHVVSRELLDGQLVFFLLVLGCTHQRVVHALCFFFVKSFVLRH